MVSERRRRARPTDLRARLVLLPARRPRRLPQSLKTSVSICLASRFPLFLWWGPSMVTIYNHAYIPVLDGEQLIHEYYRDAA